MSKREMLFFFKKKCRCSKVESVVFFWIGLTLINCFDVPRKRGHSDELMQCSIYLGKKRKKNRPL
jgi:hypothetical protein